MPAMKVLVGTLFGGVLFAASGDSDESEGAGYLFWWGVLLGIPLAIGLWLWLELGERRSREEEPLSETASIDLSPFMSPPPAEPDAVEQPAERRKVDDFKRIEGIGPKISTILREAGIQSYAELARTGVERLKEILHEANLPFADPATWPEQANLAAVGDWRGLEELQDELKGGRRV